MDDHPLLQFRSHVEGKNAEVTLWPDRIEWARQGTRRGLSGKALIGTAGLSALASFSRNGGDTNVVPIRAIQGVTTHRGGLGYTTVEVMTSGDRVSFRVSKDEAVRDGRGQSAPDTTIATLRRAC